MSNYMHSQLTGIQLNCQSLNTKLSSIKILVYKEKPDFIAFSETWLGGAKNTPKFVDYNPLWRHRDGGMGGV